MLLVLAILMTVVGIAIPTYRTIEADKEEQRFFDLLQRDIYLAQSESYRNRTSVRLVFIEGNQKYEVLLSYGGKLVTRKLPDSVQLKKNSTIQSVLFTQNGSVSASGTLRFATSTGERAAIIHLGKGRVVISE